MAAILGKAWNGYQFIFEEISDPRTKEWLFVAKPYEALTLLGLYLMFVLKWGPKFMKNRQPYNLDKLLIVYNAFQVLASLYLFINAITLAWGWEYKWVCEPVDFSHTEKAIRIARFVYLYFLIKLLDLLDTVFFVLRKKYSQVSFLHIYHHTGMVLLVWGAVTYLPGGHGTLIGVINSLVHVVMYSYYLLTVAVPSIKNAIWIKKHVTQLQILQFFLCVLHMTIIVFKTDCEYPRWVSAVFLPQNLFMLVLFIDFYIKAYIINPKKQSDTSTNSTKVSNVNGSKHSNGHNNGIEKLKVKNGINDIKYETTKNDENGSTSSMYRNNNEINHTDSETNNLYTNGKEKIFTFGKSKTN